MTIEIMAALNGGYIVTKTMGIGNYSPPLFAGTLDEALAYVRSAMMKAQADNAQQVAQ